jgi:DNA-binding CsgD family transcriptional regulator
MKIEIDALAHYGILRKSGRYPWGSGEDQSARNRSFLSEVDGLKRQGLSETEIARGFGISTTALREAKTIAKTEERQANIGMAQRLKDKGYSNVAIAERMSLNESTVRSFLAAGTKDKNEVLTTTTNMLRKQVAEKRYIDVGARVEMHVGVPETTFKTAVAALREEGYTLHYVKVEQLGTGKYTTVKVLAKPDTIYSEVFKNQSAIRQITEYSQDGGRSYLGLLEPLSISSKRVDVKYAEDGGSKADGVIYVRPGVRDISLGNDRYAQVRIAVDGTHYIKGMAIYKHDLPDGVDLQFNTNKTSTGNKLDALKAMKDDVDNPFGSVVRQITGVDANGKEVATSAMNLVNTEADWMTWKKTIASQVLSKQTPSLAKQQLSQAFDARKKEYDEIVALTNPSVRKKLLESFSDDTDAAAVHLKAAALPRQRSHVIIPVDSLKPTEIYAPNYRNGERVALIRYPHGGIFEIPELVVNNKHPESRELLGNAKAAVGIHSKVAERLSGADFDGDTVLVIPNSAGHIKTAPALAGLKDFDPVRAYPAYPGMHRISEDTKQHQMGLVSNLITDMTIQGANGNELARAVRHSMVVIDAERHNLNYKQSALDNGISQLKAKYQGGVNSGASTLISRASSEVRVMDRKPRAAAEGGAIDRTTGKRVFVETGKTYTDSKGKTQRLPSRLKSTRLAETDDAFSLSSGTVIEGIYAEHSNKLKALANKARVEMVNTNTVPYSKSAKAAYTNEVASLNAKLNIALKNSPLERQAMIVGNAIYRMKLSADPDMTASDKKKIKGQALAEARSRVGARKAPIEITSDEWNAIQSGALSPSKLDQILANTDINQVKMYATPRTHSVMSDSMVRRATSMLSSGFTQAQVSDALGISISTLSNHTRSNE